MIRYLLLVSLAAVSLAVASKPPACERNELRILDPVLRVATCLVATETDRGPVYTAVRQVLTNTGNRTIAIIGKKDLISRLKFNIFRPLPPNSNYSTSVTRQFYDPATVEAGQRRIAVLAPGESITWTIEFEDAIWADVDAATRYDIAVGYEYDYQFCSGADAACTHDPAEPVHHWPIVDDGSVWFRGVKLQPVDIPDDPLVAKRLAASIAYAKLAPQIDIRPSRGTVITDGSNVVIEISAKTDSAAIDIENIQVSLKGEDIYARCQVETKGRNSVSIRCPLGTPRQFNSVFVMVADEYGRVGQADTAFTVTPPADIERNRR